MATLNVHLPGTGVILAHVFSGKERISIGCAAENTVQIKDPSVSEHHAEILCEGETYRLRDLGSANKCRVNGAIVEKEIELHDGETIRFGNVEAVFQRDSAEISRGGEPFLRGRLTVHLPEAGESVFVLDTPLVTVGWKSDNTVRLQDPSVSGHHAQFVQIHGKYRLRDLDSLNKTFINGHTVIEAEVNDGDRLRFGAVEGVFKQDYGMRILAASPPVAEEKAAAQIRELQEKGDVLQKENERLARECAASQAACAEAQHQAEAFAQEREAWGKERESLGFHNKQLSGQLQEQSARIEDLQNAAQAGASNRSEEQQKIATLEKALQEKLAAEKTSDAEAQSRIAALTQERDTLQAASAEAQSRIAALTQERDTLQAASAEAQSRIAALTQERDTLQAASAEAQSRIAALTQERDTLQAASAEAQSRIAALAQEHDTLQAVSADAQSRIAALAQERDTLQGASADAQSRIAALTQERDTLRAAFAEAQNRITALTQARDALQTASAATQNQITAERDTLQAATAEIQSRIAVLTHERDTLQAASAESQERIAALIQERDTLQASAAEAQSRVEALKQERDVLQTASLEMTAKLAEAQNRVKELLAAEKAQALALAADPHTSLIEIAKPLLAKSSRLPRLDNSMTLKFEVDSVQVQKILETAPELLNNMRRALHAFIKNQVETRLLEELLGSLHILTEQAIQANLTGVATLSYAVEALIDDLTKIPGQINPSSLRTVSQSIDFLAMMLEEKNLYRAKDPYLANIFAVDDDPEARKTIRGAIELVHLKVICAESPKTTLAALAEQKFDLIFIDVGLPEMNGFDLCAKVRKLPEYKQTPVVFITGAVTVQNRVQSSLSGGNDFIAKPFNLLELGVKSLIWIFKGQLGLT